PRRASRLGRANGHSGPDAGRTGAEDDRRFHADPGPAAGRGRRCLRVAERERVNAPARRRTALPDARRSRRRHKLSPIIACYRDAPAIPIMYERLVAVLTRIGVDYEIIFVNDASPDNAREVLAELAARDRKVTVINHSRNFGSQSAFTSGMQVATGDAVVLLDGDLQDPPELIEQFYLKWCEGYDVVYGQRVKRDATLFLQFAYKAFYRSFRAASYVPVPLDAGDFSLI